MPQATDKNLFFYPLLLSKNFVIEKIVIVPVEDLRYQHTLKLTTLLKKCFSLFQIDVIAIFNFKNSMKKIDSKQSYKQIRFFALITSN